MIKRFGTESYIGPWLEKVKYDIKWAIQNDWPVETELFIIAVLCGGTEDTGKGS